jgi:hypothetical protein
MVHVFLSQFTNTITDLSGDMSIRKIFFLSAFFISQYLTPSLSMAEEKQVSFNFWPLFQYSSDPIEGEKEIDGLGPFFLWKKDLHRSEWAIRPLLYWTKDQNIPLLRLEFIYPFGKYQAKEGEKRGYLAPLSLYRREELGGQRRWDFQFFPFFIGETVKGEDYFGLFPFFGTLLDRYGKEEIRFYLWPLYEESTSEGARTTNLLWPFFSFTEGEKKRGYRFWPFYGQREEVGLSQTEFIMWPIYLKQRKGMDTDDPIDQWMLFPFYVSKESKRFQSKTYLWPFFSHARDRFTGFEQWDLPFPFLQSLKGENLRGIRIFPFFGYKVKEGEARRAFIFYPLYQVEEDQMGNVREKTTRILLLSRIHKSRVDQDVKSERSLRIWPLFEYERGETGYSRISFFYLLPFKDEGFDRSWFPLFRVFDWEKDPQGGISTNLLWGFYKRMKKEATDSWEVAHLVGLKRGEGWKRLFFLKGLFQYRSDERTADVRLFYAPFRLRWSHRNPSNPPLLKGARGDY